jgi:cytolysin-activating lysine-acyltransferase
MTSHQASAKGVADAGTSAAPKTVAEALGQITWLLSQSPLHRELKVKDLEWSIMPAVIHEQFRVFRMGKLPGAEQVRSKNALGASLSLESVEQMPLGVAIWAKLSEAAEAKVEKGEHLTLEEWKSGDRVWLIELISPFANAENKLLEIMLVDLIKGPFAKTAFNVHRTDQTTGVRQKVHMDKHIAATPQTSA